VVSNPDYFSLESIEDMIGVRDPPAKDLQTHELFIDLLKKMLVFNPSYRISAEEAFLHPFIGGTFS
jgi:serine/threonine protein kinase